MFAIGIGSQVTPQEISGIANPPDTANGLSYEFYVEDFDSLQEIVTNVIYSSCKAIEGTAPTEIFVANELIFLFLQSSKRKPVLSLRKWDMKGQAYQTTVITQTQPFCHSPTRTRYPRTECSALSTCQEHLIKRRLKMHKYNSKCGDLLEERGSLSWQKPTSTPSRTTAICTCKCHGRNQYKSKKATWWDSI
jgi:hypothetical protein